MNKKTGFRIMTLGVLISGTSFTAFAKPCSCCCSSVATTAPTTALTADETRDLLLMREEEKLARDVYNAMGELYNQRVFINIPRAEQHHMDAVLGLLNAYGLADPVKEGAGVFGNVELQNLYNELVTRGATSKQDAFLVGALIEEVDIQDLVIAMERTRNETIRSVYENLKGGSERHLNAFVRNYESISGETYRAQKMTQRQVNEILGR
ncbi:DUF2202 domain-containing protein [Pontiellaceae bacterium B12219]|nr:DUF2202 domain-containing protein [Pontiellaceae bacterium B12219]